MDEVEFGQRLSEVVEEGVRDGVREGMKGVLRDQLYLAVVGVGLFVALAFGYCANVHYGFELAKEKGWAGVFDAKTGCVYLDTFGVERRNAEEVSRDGMQ